MTHEYGSAIFDRHAELIRARAVSPGVAGERGSVSVDTKKRLEQAGFAPAQQNPPGLLLPWHGADGSVVLHEYRPDHPRILKGKIAKYERPRGSGARLDIAPRMRDQLHDASHVAVVTEGAFKVDALATVGVCAIGLAGVWGWCHNRKTALADWADVDLRGRELIIGFDHDAMRNPKVHEAASELAVYLAYRGARIRYLMLPEMNDDPHTGIDDFLASGASLDDLFALVFDDLPRLDERNESSASGDEPEPPPPITAPPTLAFEPNILDRFCDEVCRRGLVGELVNAQIIFLVITSRLLDKQVSAGVKGHSASGKSFTVEVVEEFFPTDAVIRFTAMSEHALIYSERDFRHKTILVYEITALRENVEDDQTSYFVRTLLSEGRLEYEVTVKVKGEFTTRTINKEGPTNLIFTTTKTSVHPENETRVLSLNTDDSNEQTARVFLELAKETDVVGDLGDWHQLQRWLEGADHNVTIPYATELVTLIPPIAVRLRRDVAAVLALIRTHAMLHQATRQRDGAGRIVACLDDYAIIRELVAPIVAEGIQATVSETVRETVELVDQLTEATLNDSGEIVHVDGVTARKVAKALKIDKSNASRRLKRAADDGYLENLETRRGRPAKWVTADPLPKDVVVLPTIDELREKLNGCAVARDNGGNNQEDERPADPPPRNDNLAPSPPHTSVNGRNRATPVDEADIEGSDSQGVSDECEDSVYPPAPDGYDYRVCDRCGFKRLVGIRKRPSKCSTPWCQGVLQRP